MKLTVEVPATVRSAILYSLSSESCAVHGVSEALSIVLVSLTFPILFRSQPGRICNKLLLATY